MLEQRIGAIGEFQRTDISAHHIIERRTGLRYMTDPFFTMRRAAQDQTKAMKNVICGSGLIVRFLPRGDAFNVVVSRYRPGFFLKQVSDFHCSLKNAPLMVRCPKLLDIFGMLT